MREEILCRFVRAIQDALDPFKLPAVKGFVCNGLE
jgi:hypothetical protein